MAKNNTIYLLFFFSFFLKVFWRTHVLFWGHWYPCFGFLVTSPLGFKARVGSALFAIFAEANVMYIPQDSPLVLHLPTSCRSLPHMHVQRWDLAQIRTCNCTNRRRMRYHCASDPAFFCRTHSHVLFWGHWYHCFGFLVTSPLGFKARVGSALFALRRRM